MREEGRENRKKGDNREKGEKREGREERIETIDQRREKS